ncbi:MAG: ATP-binding protein [Promethearchaeota archaeon]
MSLVQDYMVEVNRWWKLEFQVNYKFRQIYQAIQKYYRLRQIIALVGLRRVGKTTLMLKMIENQIQSGFDPHHILYFSFDEFGKANLRTIIHEYEELVEKNIRNGKYLVVLDEIQKLVNWENQVKSLYDLYPEVKIIVSGSESLFLQKTSKETLAGRIFTFIINPLTFREYLAFREQKFEPLKLYRREVKKLWTEYLYSQGFPELVGIIDREIITKYLKESLVDKILFKDIPQSYPVRNLTLLEAILTLIFRNPGQIIEPSKLCNDLHTTRQTLVQYLQYLENSFLIHKVYNFSQDLRKVERKKKRYYPTILAADLPFKTDSLSKSIVFEWIIMKLLHADFFWRDSAQFEVDAILIDNDGVILPIEIKYGKVATKGLSRFMKRFHISKGLIISWEKDQLIREGDYLIQIVPAIDYFLKTL